jgi:hypothetical protein
MAGRPVKILAVYVSPSHPLIRADLTACFGGGLPVLMAGDLNAKHVDLNSRMTTRRGKILRDYADGNSCLIFGPDTPTTNPYNPSVTADVLEIVLTQNLSVPVYDFVLCTKLGPPSGSHRHCLSLFLFHPPDRPDFRRTDWANFQTHLEDKIPFDPELLNGMAMDMCVENFSCAVLKALAASTPKRRLRNDLRPPIPAGIQDEYA